MPQIPYKCWSEDQRKKHRENGKRWKDKHPDKVADQKSRRYNRKKEHIKVLFHDYGQQRREYMNSLFPCQCILCSEPRQILHEKKGIRHNTDPQYILKHKEDFVPVCRRCHNMVHALMKVFGMKWEQILELKGLLIVGECCLAGS